MRTKWQSGQADGNIASQNLNGNGHDGDVVVFCGEILPDLSRKVYLLNYHQLQCFRSILKLCYGYLRIRIRMSNKKAKAPFKSSSKLSGSKGWVLFIWIGTFFTSAILTLLMSNLMDSASLVVAVILLLVIILLNILFDIIGTAITAADVVPFSSMAARKVYGAKTAISLIKSADKVSNFCNDVIGDICGIISGAASTYILIKINIVNFDNAYTNALLGGFIAALTVGGKLFGKQFAINNCNDVIYKVAVVIRFFKRK